MNNTFSILILSLTPFLTTAQTEKLSINNHQYELKTEVVINEWETKDTVQTLYEIENKTSKFVLKFYTYKDGGGDCNNYFWDRETMEVNSDSLIVTSHYFQKTGIDPLPEWRKRVYVMNDQGNLKLIDDLFRYYNSSEWVLK